MNSNCTQFTRIGKRLESLCRKALYEYKLVESKKIAIALSGGKDSLTLAYLLSKISGKGFPLLDLHAIHVSGEFSCGPAITENYLKEICDTLHIPLTIVESKQKRETLACYSCSRERRRLLFHKAKDLEFQTIAFGHHLDDSIQTLLMNLLHKGEFAANLTKIYMHDYDITIIRPLIYVFEKDILSFAKTNGFARIMCQCPIGQKSKRNDTKILIENMEKLFPNARNNLAIASREYGSKKALTK